MSDGIQYGRRRRLVHALSWLLIRHPFKGSLRVQDGFGRALLPRPVGPTIARTLYGFDLKVNPVFDHGLERALYYRGTYEAGTLWVIENCLRAGDCFVDIGGNIGLMTVFAARRVADTGKVLVFEPDSDTFEILQNNVTLNKLTNVQAFPFALGGTTETRPLYRALGNRGHSSLLPTGHDDEAPSVSVLTLDEFMDRHRDSPPRMIKIDVEGWELEVLKGAQVLLTSPTAPILSIEYSRPAVNDGRLLDCLFAHLCSLGQYRIFRPIDGKANISRLRHISCPDDLPYEDNLFCFTDRHLDQVPHALFA